MSPLYFLEPGRNSFFVFILHIYITVGGLNAFVRSDTSQEYYK